MTKLYTESKVYDVAHMDRENPLPFFSDEIEDFAVSVDNSMTEEEIRYIGWANGRKVLPYKMQDHYTREIKKRELKTIVLENRHLRVEILPELEGRIYSLYDKDEKKELLFKNPCIHFANLAIRDAWWAGGIEWNMAQFGHSYFTCSPVYVAKINLNGSAAGIRIYEYERRKGIFWQIDLHLPEDSKHLLCHMKFTNNSRDRLPMYWWTNIAVKETRDTRVIAPASEVIYMNPFRELNYDYGKSTLPNIPPLNKKDATFPGNYNFASEMYYQCQNSQAPWGVAVEKDGYGILEMSTKRLPVKKMFCSGMFQGGKHWKEFVSREGEAYIELQSGVGRTQQHSIPMEAGETWEWTEIFGPIKTDPEKAYSEDWHEVVSSIEKTVYSIISPEEMNEIDRRLAGTALANPGKILHRGSGWGALEIERCKYEGLEDSIPSSMVFPVDSIGSEEKPWFDLLRYGKLPEVETSQIPVSWMVQIEWLTLLEKSLKTGKSWYSLLHYGVMLLENNRKEEAKKAWKESIELKPSAWAFRNLGQCALREGELTEACKYMERAWERASMNGIVEAGLLEEYLGLLVKCEMYDNALEVYESQPKEMQDVDRVQMIRARIAYEKNDFDTLDEIFKKELACVREGETELTDLWFGMWEKKLAGEDGSITSEEVRRRYPPPENIDFRRVLR